MQSRDKLKTQHSRDNYPSKPYNRPHRDQTSLPGPPTFCQRTDRAEKVLSEDVLRVSEHQARLADRGVADYDDLHERVECIRCHSSVVLCSSADVVRTT